MAVHTKLRKGLLKHPLETRRYAGGLVLNSGYRPFRPAVNPADHGPAQVTHARPFINSRLNPALWLSAA